MLDEMVHKRRRQFDIFESLSCCCNLLILVCLRFYSLQNQVKSVFNCVVRALILFGNLFHLSLRWLLYVLESIEWFSDAKYPSKCKAGLVMLFENRYELLFS